MNEQEVMEKPTAMSLLNERVALQEDAIVGS